MFCVTIGDSLFDSHSHSRTRVMLITILILFSVKMVLIWNHFETGDFFVLIWNHFLCATLILIWIIILFVIFNFPTLACTCKQAVGSRPPRYVSAPCKFKISSHVFARWHLFRHVGYSRHQQQVDLCPFDLESGVRVTCDVGYLCANFSLPWPFCSRVTPDVRDRR